MFLHMLEKDERTTFLSLAKYVAELNDAQVDARERYMLQYMCAEMGLDPNEIALSDFHLDTLLKVFFREEARRIAIVEAVGVAHAGGKVHPAQRALLEQLCEKFFLPADFLARAESVVARQLDVMNDFETLVQAG